MIRMASKIRNMGWEVITLHSLIAHNEVWLHLHLKATDVGRLFALSCDHGTII